VHGRYRGLITLRLSIKSAGQFGAYVRLGSDAMESGQSANGASRAVAKAGRGPQPHATKCRLPVLAGWWGPPPNSAL